MTPELWQRVKQIFQLALEKSSEEQSAFIDEAAGNDPIVVEEVRSLLAHATSGGIFEASPFELLVQATGELMTGRLIGPYRIVREIEAGGMGEVYEAVQEKPIRRRVALKLIKRGFDTDRVIARFESERQALALMNHPNIAQVFDAGARGDGRPYFVMELVEGEPITDYCARHRLNIRERLDLFKQICAGVQHAHQKGIIHRDLKPSNIMVALLDGKAVPKIIDFGIAKAIDPSGRPFATKRDERIGTPGYMSPEQTANKDVDTRTDVYSLGVVLNELLVGELPHEIERSGVPPRPSQRIGLLGKRAAEVARDRRTELAALKRQLSGDLDWVVTKALEEDRGRRYASASELAIDIDRHLRSEPVLASPPGTVYRLGKFLRRHRVGVVAGAVAVLALIFGVAGAGIGLVRARRAEGVARQEALKASQEAETARRTSDFLVGLFEVSAPDNTNGNTITAREILDAGSRKIASELQGQPQTRATLLDTMGVVYQSLGLFDSAEPLLKEALVLRRKKFGEINTEVAKSLNDLGELRRALGRYPEAEALHRRALTIREQMLGSKHVDVADSFNKLGLVYYNQGRYTEAEPFFKRALDIWRELGDFHETTALSHLALVYRDEGKYDQAIPLFEHALAIQEKKLSPEHSDIGANLNNLADIYRSIGKYAKAELLLKRVLATNEKMMGMDHPFVTTVMNNLAMVYRAEGKYTEAESLFKRVLAVDEKVRGAEHPDFASSLHNLALVYREQGRYTEAEPLFLRALAIRERRLSPEHPHVAGSLNQLGLLYAAQNRYTKAESLFQRSLAIREKALGPTHPHVAVTLTNLANLYRQQGKYSQAEPLLMRALAVWENLPQPNLLDLITTLEGEAALLRETSRTAEAVRMDSRVREFRAKLDEGRRKP